MSRPATFLISVFLAASIITFASPATMSTDGKGMGFVLFFGTSYIVLRLWFAKRDLF